jgi:predicted SAM-dependent methyltransferase
VLRAAQVHCDAKFIQANATELSSFANPGQISAIIFFAVLEHMTWEERLTSLRAAWDLLQKGQHLIVIESPNRL